MSSILTGQTPAGTYGGVLHIDPSLDGTLRRVYDGFGNSLPIQVSDDGIVIDQPLVLTQSLTIDSLTISDASSSLVPAVDNTYNLGSPSKRWANLYVTTLNFTAPVPIASGGTGATTAAAARVNLFPVMTGLGNHMVQINPAGGDLDYTVFTVDQLVLTVNDQSIAGVKTFTSKTILASVDSDVIPTTTATHSLGGTSNRWVKVWTAGLDITGSVTGSLAPATDLAYNVGAPTSRWNTVYTNAVNTNFLGVNGYVQTPLVPYSGGLTLGVTGNRWDTAYLDNLVLTNPLPVASGGTGATTASAHRVFAGPTSGGASAPTFRALVATDIPTLDHTYISDFDTQVRTSRLDQMAAPGADVSMAGYKITNLGTPSAGTDAANKSYVDGVATGLTPRTAATVATTAALPSVTYANGSGGVGATLTATANGALTVDTYAVQVGDYVLVKNQVAGLQNGLYYVTQKGDGSNPFILTRAEGMNSDSEIVGSLIPVEDAGLANQNSLWLCTNSGSVTVGTTALTFTQLNKGTDLQAGTGIDITGNTVSVNGNLATLRALANAAGWLHNDGAGVLSWSTPAPAGADTYVQFNNAGAFGGSANFTWDGTSLVLGSGKSLGVGVSPSAVLHVKGAIGSSGQAIIQDSGGTGTASAHSMAFTDSAGTRQAAISKIVTTGVLSIINDQNAAIQMSVNGTVRLSVNATNTTFSTNAIPNATATYDLGATGSRWNNAYIATLTLTNPLTVGNGGTGASTAAGGRANLLPSYAGNSLYTLRVNAGETDVEWAAGGSGLPSGPDTSIQFNDGGVFGGTADLTWDGASLTCYGNVYVAGSSVISKFAMSTGGGASLREQFRLSGSWQTSSNATRVSAMTIQTFDANTDGNGIHIYSRGARDGTMGMVINGTMPTVSTTDYAGLIVGGAVRPTANNSFLLGALNYSYAGIVLSGYVYDDQLLPRLTIVSSGSDADSLSSMRLTGSGIAFTPDNTSFSSREMVLVNETTAIVLSFSTDGNEATIRVDSGVLNVDADFYVKPGSVTSYCLLAAGNDQGKLQLLTPNTSNFVFPTFQASGVCGTTTAGSMASSVTFSSVRARSGADHTAEWFKISSFPPATAGAYCWQAVIGNRASADTVDSLPTSGLKIAGELLVQNENRSALTAGTEWIEADFNFNSRTLQFATGGITTQRAMVVRRPKYAFVGASTITNAITLDILGGPAADTNATLTNSIALRVQAGGTTNVPLQVLGAISQTANLLEVRDGGSVLVFGISADADVSMAPRVRTTGSPTLLTLTGPAHTTLTASVEVTDINFNLARSIQFSTGAITTQRAVRLQAPTYAFVGASTITTAVHFDIDSAPVAGTNATLTTSIAARIGTGFAAGVALCLVGAASQSGDYIDVRDSGGTQRFKLGGNADITMTPVVRTTGSPTHFTLTGAAHTTLMASAEAIDIYLNLGRTVQFSTGALTTQRAVAIAAPTYAFSGASTLTTGVTLDIDSAPVPGTNATITNAITLRLGAGHAAGIPLQIKLAASQTGDAVQILNSGGTAIFQIDKNGYCMLTPFTFCLAPDAAATTGTSKTFIAIAPADGKIVECRIEAKTGPTGADFIADINLDGTSIWASTQSNRIKITAGGTSGTQTSFDTTTFTKGQKFTIDIDQIGSTIAGQDITVLLTCLCKNVIL